MILILGVSGPIGVLVFGVKKKLPPLLGPVGPFWRLVVGGGGMIEEFIGGEY